MKNWYTYLIGWKTLDLWYYGYRGAKSPHDDLWIKYFTSSKCVSGIRDRFGEPDVVKIHKIFDNDTQARTFENKFLRRVKAVTSKRWLNQHDCGDNWVVKRGKIPSQNQRTLVSQSLKGKLWWTNGVHQVKNFTSPGEGWYRGRLKGQLSESGREERKRKLSESRWWYKDGQRTRAKDCPGEGWLNQKGPESNETKIKKSQSRTGMKHSEETKLKISESHIKRNSR